MSQSFWSGTHPLPTSTWQKWPGAGIPMAARPPNTLYVGHNLVPQYPLEATCSMLGEQDPFFPITWHLGLLGFAACLLYIVWPLYVLRHLVRRKSVYGGDEVLQNNYDAYKAKLDELSKRRDELSEE